MNKFLNLRINHISHLKHLQRIIMFNQSLKVDILIKNKILHLNLIKQNLNEFKMMLHLKNKQCQNIFKVSQIEFLSNRVLIQKINLKFDRVMILVKEKFHKKLQTLIHPPSFLLQIYDMILINRYQKRIKKKKLRSLYLSHRLIQQIEIKNQVKFH